MHKALHNLFQERFSWYPRALFVPKWRLFNMTIQQWAIDKKSRGFCVHMISGPHSLMSTSEFLGWRYGSCCFIWLICQKLEQFVWITSTASARQHILLGKPSICVRHLFPCVHMCVCVKYLWCPLFSIWVTIVLCGKAENRTLTVLFFYFVIRQLKSVLLCFLKCQ